MTCRCNSNLSYDACCKPFHDGKALPKTPEKLMRSRYSAYALGNVEYLIDTTDKDGPYYKHDLIKWRKEITLFSTTTSFQNLSILEKEMYNDNEGTVTFHAQLMSAAGNDKSFTEKSLFKKKRGKWLYVERL